MSTLSPESYHTGVGNFCITNKCLSQGQLLMQPWVLVLQATGAVQWEPPDIPGGWGDAEQDHGPGERNGHLTVERSRHSVGGEANPVAWSRMVEEAAGGGADAGGVDTGAYSTFGAEGFSTVSTMSSASSGHASQVTMAAGDAGASNLHNGEARTDALLLCDAAPPGTDQAAVVVKSSLRYQFDGEAGVRAWSQPQGGGGRLTVAADEARNLPVRGGGGGGGIVAQVVAPPPPPPAQDPRDARPLHSSLA